MSLFAAHDDSQPVGRGHHRPGTIGNDSYRLRPNVQPEDGAGNRILKDSLLDHQRRAAPLSSRSALLGRLKNEFHCPRDLRAHSCEDLCHPHEDCNMIVVATGMHHANVVSIVLGALGRLERQIDEFCNGKCIHVGAQCNHRTRTSAAQHADDPGVRYASSCFDSESCEMVRNKFCRSRLTVR